jgi:hypothetical protein
MENQSKDHRHLYSRIRSRSIPKLSAQEEKKRRKEQEGERVLNKDRERGQRSNLLKDGTNAMR